MLYVLLYFLKRRNRGLGAFSCNYDSGYIVCEDGGLLEALSFCQHDSQRRCEGIAGSGCINGVYRNGGDPAYPGLFGIHIDALLSKGYQNVFNSLISELSGGFGKVRFDAVDPRQHPKLSLVRFDDIYIAV